MSRRSRRRGEAGRREPRERDASGRVSGRRAPGGSLSTLPVQLVVLAAVFAVAVLIAELAGAANLGVALGVGQIAFAISLVYLLLRH
jgi:hypothetical protein